MNKRSRTVPVTLFTDCEALLAEYRVAIEQLDGVGSYKHFSDADMIAIAARVGMRQTIEVAQAKVKPK